LAAALAHEVAHVLDNRRRRRGALNLKARDAAADAEADADRIGMRLLAVAGLPPGSMATMLAKVRELPALLRATACR
jgi:predicted Zn-dependent protease